MFIWDSGYRPNFVDDNVGKANPKILLIGEAPGALEDGYQFHPLTHKLLTIIDDKGEIVRQPKKAGVHLPFVGKSGDRLGEWLLKADLSKEDLHITNVFPWRPENNDFSTIPEELLDKWISILHAKIADNPQINVIVPTGANALKALTGKQGIGDWRGSILPYIDRNGLIRKVIPTYHPAASFHQPDIAYFTIADWRRIAADRKFTELNLFKSEAVIHPNKDDISQFLIYVLKHPEIPLSIDIENDPKTHRVSCVGFGIEERKAICIPLEDEEYWPSGKDRQFALNIVKLLCETPNEKILQGGFHDAFYLFRRFGITLVNYLWDTSAMHHCLIPTAPTKLKPHALDKIASIHQRTSFWKSDAKDSESVKGYNLKDKNLFFTYNCRDVCETYALKNILQQKLKDEGKLDLYLKAYAPLFDPLLDMSTTGVLVDNETRRNDLVRLIIQCHEIKNRIAAKAGKPLHAEKGLSVKKLTTFFYGKYEDGNIGFKKQAGSPTEELTLKKLRKKYTETVNKGVTKKVTSEILERYKLGLSVLEDVLEHREKYQLATVFFPKNIDEDKRLRCKYKFTTTFCRLASSKNAFKTGRNLQNIPHDAKHIFIPDSQDMVFIELDLSQIENRIVFCLTGDPELIKLAKVLPSEFDIHTYNASFLFGVPESQVTYEMRQIGKKIIHAGNYGEGPDRLSQVLFQNGYSLTVPECKAKMDNYFERFPAIPKWQRATHQEGLRNRMLENSWGQKFYFYWDEANKHLLNRLLACRPQSDNGMMLNIQGVIPAYRYLKDTGYGRVVLQVHDSILICCYKKRAYDVACNARDFLEAPHNFYGTELCIPTQLKVGLNYAKMMEHKIFPTSQEFNLKLEELYVKN